VKSVWNIENEVVQMIREKIATTKKTVPSSLDVFAESNWRHVMDTVTMDCNRYLEFFITVKNMYLYTTRSTRSLSIVRHYWSQLDV
jgi:hypothetical protein